MHLLNDCKLSNSLTAVRSLNDYTLFNKLTIKKPTTVYLV